MKTQIITKAGSVTLAMAMALTLTPMVNISAKAKKPSLQDDSYYLREGEHVTIQMDRNGSTIKNTTWKSTKKSVFTVKKKSNTKATINGIKKGKAKLKAIAKTKTGKTYRMSAGVEVDDPLESLLTINYNWTKPETPEIDDTLKSIFEKATAEFASQAVYTPVALLGLQMMGTDVDYLVFARRTPVIAGGKTTYSLLIIHDSIMGGSVASEVIDTDIEAFISGDPDGWNETETPLVDKTADLVFQKAFEGLDGFNYTPLALLATRKTNETDYCFITEFMPLSPDATPSYNLVTINVNDAGEVKLGTIYNIVEGREAAKNSADRASTDKQDLDRGKNYVCLWAEAMIRYFNHGRIRGLDASNRVLWDFTTENGQAPDPNNFIKVTNLHDPVWKEWEAYTYGTGYWSTPELTTRIKSDTMMTNEFLLNGKYDFKKDLDELEVGWQMFTGKTSKSEIQTRINNTISDTVYNKIVKDLKPDDKCYANYDGGRFILYGYDSKKGQIVGKFIGVMSGSKGPGSTIYFDVIGCNPNDTTYYGKRITESVTWQSVNSNYD